MRTHTRPAFRPALESAEPRLLMAAVPAGMAFQAAHPGRVSEQAVAAYTITVNNDTKVPLHLKYEAFIPTARGGHELASSYRNFVPVEVNGYGGQDVRFVNFTTPTARRAEPYYNVIISNQRLGLFEARRDIFKPANANQVTLTITEHDGRLHANVR